jgi:biopolymer transport protein ExbD
MKKKKELEINAGSMADIAFLLLVFFLMTSSMSSEKGLSTILPAKNQDSVSTHVPKRAVLNITVNSDDQLLIENEVYTDESVLKDLVIAHILNEDNDLNRPAAPDQAIIAIQNDRSTTYLRYIGIYDQIKTAYQQIWDEKTPEMFEGKTYKELTSLELEILKDQYPVVISESEPTDFAMR